MSAQYQLSDIKNSEKSIFTLAFHPNIRSAAKAKKQLENAAPGTFLTFSVRRKNYCAAVGRDGEVFVNVFRWDASGAWYNFSMTPYETEMDLLDHLVDGQEPIPFCG
jgi:hypothetical protein